MEPSAFLQTNIRSVLVKFQRKGFACPTAQPSVLILGSMVVECCGTSCPKNCSSKNSLEPRCIWLMVSGSLLMSFGSQHRPLRGPLTTETCPSPQPARPKHRFRGLRVIAMELEKMPRHSGFDRKQRKERRRSTPRSCGCGRPSRISLNHNRKITLFPAF